MVLILPGVHYGGYQQLLLVSVTSLGELLVSCCDVLGRRKHLMLWGSKLKKLMRSLLSPMSGRESLVGFISTKLTSPQGFSATSPSRYGTNLT